MIATDEELKRWWRGLARAEQSEILERIEEHSSRPDWADSLRRQYDRGIEFNTEQLASIRKWAP